MRPKDNIVCPSFTEADTSLLNGAVPNLVSDGSKTILDHEKAKCYGLKNRQVRELFDLGL